MSPDVTSPHLVLVGLPGSGKSAVGRAAARRLGRRFLDFDEEIERRTGLTVRRIFEEHGEARFRSHELELTRDLVGAEGMVLAPGGGWVAISEAVALIKPRALMVYLRASPATLVRRMGEGLTLRPKLDGDPTAELARLLAQRESAYLAADRVVDVELLDLQDVIDVVCRMVAPLQGA